ncbi:hypothetical protein LTR36_005299 [Oleoguttula mirabilis]|uniref:HTH La-type RNA-binding domain-containing protein n=1 Tax=Oleoguttula mirabilis TaxID=1507867 RepID=A0AAV9JED1_9PEZI|nr:hypothetical protein LTR36_005299 [Oleoguttula mirabilis]
MAAVTSSPSGFSYAQAAKGRSPAVAAKAPASKATSSAGQPATGTFSELTTGGNWADDVEASVGDKAAESQKPAQQPSGEAPVKDSVVERAKSEDKVQNAASGVSSPDLAASSSTTTKDDDSLSVPTNGSSSETTWETKSQGSEPAWIAERKERQSTSQNSDSTVKGEKKGKESTAPPPPKPVVLQDAAPPTVNPWLKRAEEKKVRTVTQQPATKPVASAPASDVNTPKENQRPRADSRKKASSVAGPTRNGEAPSGASGESRKSGGVPGKRASEVRISGFHQSSKPTTGDVASPGPTRPTAQTRASLPNPATAPPPVKDAVSWPTPDTAQEKERRDVMEKDTQEKQTEESTPSMKSRKKPEWQSMVVTPNIIFETQNIRGRESRGPSTGERGGRGGMRGRGGYRGGANGVNGSERPAGRVNHSSSESENSASLAQRGRSNTADRDAMPPPAKPDRASSESSRRGQPTEPRSERVTRGQSLTETQSFATGSKSGAKMPEEDNASGAWNGAQPDALRTQSPHKIDTPVPDAKDEERIPEPIPRRSSTDAQMNEKGEQDGGATRDAPPIRMVPSEARKEPRTFENAREPNFTPTARGAKRNARGRGGSRELANGHSAHHAYSNGDFVPAAAFGVPPSPSHPGPRGNHQFAYSQQNRGGWTRGNPRSQSIPIEGYYGRYPYAQSQLPPVQTYVPGMYDSYGYPMTAMPYQPYMDHQYLMDMVSTQMEYYFSLDNLLKDMFLRKHMDSQGFVFLDVIASFNRIKQLTQDKDLLKAVCIASDTIEIRVGEDGKERLRRRDGWNQFLLPLDQRETSAQTEGPKHLSRPERPQLQVFGPPSGRGPQSALHSGPQQRFDRRSHEAGYPTLNGMAPQFTSFPAVPEAAYGETMNGEDIRGRAAKSPIRAEDASPPDGLLADGKDSAPDAFPDDQISVLVVVVQPRPPYHSAATRTFSNGSIDSRSIFGEMEKSEKPNESQKDTKTNGDTLTNGTDVTPSASRQPSPSAPRSHDRAGATPDFSLWWMKDGSALSDPPRGVSLEPYVQLRLKALDQRNHAATGTCPYDLDVLYQFWCHFLIRNFNSRMYGEFKYYATNDGEERHNCTGLQSLVKFYAQALSSHNPIRDRLLKDYLALVNAEPPQLEGAAFKQLRSAWRNGALNLKNRKKLADLVDESLKERLET